MKFLSKWVLTSAILIFLLSAAGGIKLSAQEIQAQKPLTLAQIEALVTNRTPVQAIVLEIRKRGIGFEATEVVLSSLRKLGAGEPVIQELKKAQIKPLDEKPSATTATDDGVIRVLVANFGNPNEQSDAITETIIEQLRKATRDYPDVEIKALNQTITALEGEPVAKAKGKAQQADIVLWGWYKKTSQKVLINAHFEVISEIPRLSLNENSQTLIAPLPEFEGFAVQLQLSKEMTYLTLLAIGLIRFEADDYDAAVEHFTKALAQQTSADKMVNAAAAYRYRAAANFLKLNTTGIISNADKIIEDLNQAIKLSPDAPEPYSILISTYIAKQDKAAFAYIEKLNALAEKEADAFKKAHLYYLIGSAYSYINDDDAEARKYFSRTIKLLMSAPDTVEKFFILSISYFAVDDFLQAAVSLDKAQNLVGPGSKILPMLLLLKGAAYAQAENYELALENFKKSFELNSNYLPARVALIELFKEMEEPDLALVQLNKAIALYPDEARLYSSRAEIYKTKEDFDKAVADYKKVIELAPNDFENYYRLGFIYNRLKRFDDAIEIFTKYLKIKPNDAFIYSIRGGLYKQIGEEDKYVADYKTSISLRVKQNKEDEVSGTKAMFFELFSHFIRNRDYKSGIELAEQYIAFRPKEAEGYKERAYFLGVAKEFDRAIEDLTRAISLDANDTEAYRKRAGMWENKNDFEKAIADINRAIALTPKDFELYLERAELYEKKGDLTEALKSFDQALEVAVRADHKERVRLEKRVFQARQKVKPEER